MPETTSPLTIRWGFWSGGNGGSSGYRPEPAGNVLTYSRRWVEASVSRLSSTRIERGSGRTANWEPSGPWTIPPSAPRAICPVAGIATRTGTTTWAEPLIMVTAAEPGSKAVTRPSALTWTTAGLLVK